MIEKIFPPLTWTLFERCVPILAALLMPIIAISSSVPLSLVLVSGAPATAISLLYSLVLLTMAVRPSVGIQLHALGFGLALLTFLGRAAGFVERSIERGEWSLSGAITERLLLLLLMVLWHRMMPVLHALRKGEGNGLRTRN